MVGIAAEGEISVFVFAVVGPDGGVAVAILFFAGFAGIAFAAGIDHAADAGQIAYFEFADFRTDAGDDADNFVAGNHGVERTAPFVAGLMNIGVADTAKFNVEQDVFGAGLAMFEVEWRGRGFCVLSGVTVSCNHILIVPGTFR